MSPQHLLRKAERNAAIAQRDLAYYRGLMALQQRNADRLPHNALPDATSIEHRVRHAEHVFELAIQYRDFLRRTIHQTGTAS